MRISKQTLFLYKIDKNNGETTLFDLKTLTKLWFSSAVKAQEFCEVFGEKECLAEIQQVYKGKTLDDYIVYISTDDIAKKHIILCRYTNGMYVSKCDSLKLLEYTKKGIVQNLVIDKSSSKLIRKWILEPAPKGFKDCIQEQYNEYIKSTRLLGNSGSLKYIIIGKYVILTKVEYTETLTVPNFITSISKYIDEDTLKEIKLTDGVRYIGSSIVYNDATLKLCGGRNVEYIGNSSNGNDEVIINRK